LPYLTFEDERLGDIYDDYFRVLLDLKDVDSLMFFIQQIQFSREDYLRQFATFLFDN